MTDVWLMTPLGFFSAVEDPGDPTTLVVRTRAIADAQALCRWLDAECGLDLRPETKVASDYPWRVFVPREAWASFVYSSALDIDYGNFKNRVAEVNYKRARVYGFVWSVLLGVEAEDKPQPVASKRGRRRRRRAETEELPEYGNGRGGIFDLTEDEWVELMETGR